MAAPFYGLTFSSNFYYYCSACTFKNHHNCSKWLCFQFSDENILKTWEPDTSINISIHISNKSKQQIFFHHFVELIEQFRCKQSLMFDFLLRFYEALLTFLILDKSIIFIVFGLNIFVYIIYQNSKIIFQTMRYWNKLLAWWVNGNRNEFICSKQRELIKLMSCVYVWYCCR